MAYSIDPVSGDLIIGGFENGIGDSPYTGLTDLKGVNVTSIPGEASVSFATQTVTSAPSYSAVTLTSAGVSNVFTSTQALLLEQYQAVYVTASTISGLSSSATNPLYVYAPSSGGGTNTFGFTTVYGGTSGISTGTTGTATFSTHNLVLGPRGTLTKNYTALSSDGFHWIADSNGLVWSDKVTTQGGTGIVATNSWTYTGNRGNAGNSPDSSAGGNAMVYLQTVTAGGGLDGWLFLWRQGQIDYLKVITANTTIAASSLAWQYAWKTGLELSVLYGSNTLYSHEAVVTPGQRVAFCDAYIMGLFYQTSTATTFDPTNASTYTYNAVGTGFNILPVNDIAQCCSYLGSLLYIGGIKNVIYPWDLTSAQFTAPLVQCSEKNIKNIVNVNQNGYVFAGNRGRIFIINGSQASVWKKMPDHISGTVQPTFQWGDAISINNQLYFGIYRSSGANVSSSNVYGGVWGIDLDSRSIYLSNKLSDGTYAGYCSALLQMGLGEATGNGFYAGWYDSANSSGIDVSIGTPYAGGQSNIVSDMIPVGTALQPNTASQIEFKLSTPLLTGESVQLLMGSSLADYVNNTFTNVGTVSGTGVELSGNFPITVQKQQWLLVKGILTGIASNPSYNRITQLRVIGDTVKSNVPNQPFTIR